MEMMDGNHDFYYCNDAFGTCVIYRFGNDGGDYGSCPLTSISPISPHHLVALHLLLKHLGVNGSRGLFLQGKAFFKDGEVVLSVNDNNELTIKQ